MPRGAGALHNSLRLPGFAAQLPFPSQMCIPPGKFVSGWKAGHKPGGIVARYEFPERPCSDLPEGLRHDGLVPCRRADAAFVARHSASLRPSSGGIPESMKRTPAPSAPDPTRRQSPSLNQNHFFIPRASLSEGKTVWPARARPRVRVGRNAIHPPPAIVGLRRRKSWFDWPLWRISGSISRRRRFCIAHAGISWSASASNLQTLNDR